MSYRFSVQSASKADAIAQIAAEFDRVSSAQDLAAQPSSVYGFGSDPAYSDSNYGSKGAQPGAVDQPATRPTRDGVVLPGPAATKVDTSDALAAATAAVNKLTEIPGQDLHVTVAGSTSHSVAGVRQVDFSVSAYVMDVAGTVKGAGTLAERNAGLYGGVPRNVAGVPAGAQPFNGQPRSVYGY